MTTLAQQERAALANLMDEVGPEAPTLCEGWRSTELAAHLVVREANMLASVGIVVNKLSNLHDSAIDRAVQSTSYPDLVSQVRNGPPKWSGFRIGKVDEMANGAEYFIHHEDVRRAVEGWEPRELRDADEAYLWAVVSKRGRVFFRSSPVGVVLRTPDGREAKVIDKPNPVTLTGKPSELAMFAFGRREHALVELTGDADALRAFEGVDLGV
jgi:uncharacterized protein (TIGR03085 family)